MKKLLVFTLLLIVGNAFADAAQPHLAIADNNVPYQHAIWNGIPIQFSIPVGKERILKFNQPVVFRNNNRQLTSDKVNILNNNGFLYIKARKLFSPIRVEVVLQKSGKVVLVDLSSAREGGDTPINVIMQHTNAMSDGQGNQIKAQAINDITLMRYAIQHIYAPQRLIKENDLIARTPMYTSHSINLFNNDKVMAMPLVSWHGGGLYVTAILLKNIWNQSQVLDPRNIHGQWIASSFYPNNYLTAAHTMHDRTTVFLISDKPFNEALNQVRGYY